MSIHDENLILSVVDCQWAEGHMKDISTKFCQVTVAIFCLISSCSWVYWPASSSAMMEDLVDVTEENRTGKRAHIEVSSRNVGFDQLKSMCANFTLLGQVILL